MTLNTQPTILLIGNDATLSYLLGRFAEGSGYQWQISTENASSREIEAIDPAVIIFLSTELLARDQTFVTELAERDVPIVVCSSVIEETWARELGADYCLLHPLTYDDFQTTLTNATKSNRS